MERFSLFRGRKCSFRAIPKFKEESIPKLGMKWNYRKKCVLKKILLPKTQLKACFCAQNALEPNSKSLLLFLFQGTEFRVVFSSGGWFRTEFREFASIYVLQNRISSIFLLFGIVRNGIPRVFYSAELPEFRRNKPIVPCKSFFC